MTRILGATDLAALALMALAAAALLAVLVGWGRLARRLLSPGDRTAGDSWSADAWTGWCAGVVFLQLWHMVLPIDWRTAAVVAAIGAMGWRAGAKPAASSDRGQAWVVGSACFALFALMVRHVRSDLPKVFDAGMYYYQAIRWINEYPVVPGLGNLNMQLGVNQSYFLWAGLLNLHPLWRSGFLVMNCLAVVLAMEPGIRALVPLWRRERKPEALDVWRVLTLPILTIMIMNEGAANPGPDFFVWLMCIAVFDRTAARLRDIWADAGRTPHPPYDLVLLGAVLVTVKLSVIVFSGTLLAVVVAAFIPRMWPGVPWPVRLRQLAVAAAIALVAGLPWMARNVVMSGYPVFPSTVAAFPVDWKVPERKVQFAEQYILAWARHPGPEKKAFRKRLKLEETKNIDSAPDALSPAAIRDLVRNEPWFRPWLADALRSPLAATLLAGPVILGAVLAVLGFWRRPGPDAAGYLRLLYIPLLAGIAFWLCAAPAIRFALPLLALLLVLQAARILSRADLRSVSLGRAVGALSVLLAAALIAAGCRPLSDRWRSEVIPRRLLAPSRPYTTRSGLIVNVPGKGSLCFDNRLPSTHVRNPNLALRNPAQGLRGGFMEVVPPTSPHNPGGPSGAPPGR